MGVLTVTNVRRGTIGDIKYSIADVLGSASYATGGESVTPQALGFSTTIHTLLAMSNDSVADNRMAQAVPQADGSMKLVLLTAVNTEVANTTNVSTIGFRIRAEGF